MRKYRKYLYKSNIGGSGSSGSAGKESTMSNEIDYFVGLIAASCAAPVTYVPKGRGINELLINVLGGGLNDGSESIRRMV